MDSTDESVIAVVRDVDEEITQKLADSYLIAREQSWDEGFQTAVVHLTEALRVIWHGIDGEPHELSMPVNPYRPKR